MLAQSIQIDNPTSPFCFGKNLEIPTEISGSFPDDNSFHLEILDWETGERLEKVETNDSFSPFHFEVPRRVSQEKFHRTVVLRVIATNPNIQSNEVLQDGNKPPRISQTRWIDDNGISLTNVNPKGLVYLEHDFFDESDFYKTYFELNDGRIFDTSVKSINFDTSGNYYIKRVFNDCGDGVVSRDTLQLKVNDFKIKITDYYPSKICDERKVKVNIDAQELFQPNSEFTLTLFNDQNEIELLEELILEKSNPGSFSIEIPESIGHGFYYIKVCQNDLNVCTSSQKIEITPKPFLEFHWTYSSSLLEYNETKEGKLMLELGSQNITPVRAWLSDGQILDGFTPVSSYYYHYDNYRQMYLKNISIRTDSSRFIKVDSVLTSCGMNKVLNQTGQQHFYINDEFSFEKMLIQDFYFGDTVRPILRNFPPGFDYEQYQAEILFQNDRLSLVPLNESNGEVFFIIPNLPQFTFQEYSFRFRKSDGSLLSQTYKHEFNMIFKTEIHTLSSILRTSNGHWKGGFSMGGVEPVSMLVVKNETDTLEVVFDEVSKSDSYYYPNWRVRFKGFDKRNATFRILGIKTVRSDNNFEPVENAVYNVYLNTVESILFKDEFIKICQGLPANIEIDTIGHFPEFETFKVYLQSYPENKFIGEFDGLTFDFVVPIFSSQEFIQGAMEIQAYNRFGEIISTTYSPIIDFLGNHEVNFGSLDITEGLFPIEFENVSVLEGSSVRVNLKTEEFYKTETFKYLINGKWVSRPEKIASLQNDFTYQIDSVSSSCGVFPVQKSLTIRPKSQQLSFKILSLENHCSGSTIRIHLFWEPMSLFPIDTGKVAVWMHSNNGDSTRMSISRWSNNTLTVKLPFLLDYRWNQISLNYEDSSFARSLKKETIALGDKPSVMIAFDEKPNILWQNPYGHRKLSLISQHDYLHWKAELSDFENISLDDISGSLDTTFWRPLYSHRSPFTIKNLESNCGYGANSNTVIIKPCFSQLQIPFDVGEHSEYFSEDTIEAYRFSITKPDESKLYSAKKSILLQPGFETVSDSSFIAEIKGCSFD